MVTVGFTLVEPLADVDVNVPGVIATPVAPAVDQLNVLLRPEFTPLGSAAKEMIVGAPPFAGDEVDEPPQSASPIQASKMRTNGRRPGREESPLREMSLFLENQSVESMQIFDSLGYICNRRRRFLFLVADRAVVAGSSSPTPVPGVEKARFFRMSTRAYPATQSIAGTGRSCSSLWP
ncbi:MAG TPA: hypothetical protein VEI99_08990 [Terriglobales bacterium]|nr:hypothetical protein [Terriglobales bacterium]